MKKMWGNIAKGLIAVTMSLSVISIAAPILACEEEPLPYLEGQHSEITTVSSVEYQEYNKTFFFVTKGSVDFWVLDIKQEPYTKQRMDYYKKLYEGQKVQIDFTVEKGSITSIKHHLVPAVPVMQPKK